MSLRAYLVAGLLLLQAADIALTWRLLTTREDVIEANPVARAMLDAHGWPGAVALKLACTSVALACVFAIGRTRPIYSQGLLAGLCALMLGVVGYSGAVMANPPDFPTPAPRGKLSRNIVKRAEMGERPRRPVPGPIHAAPRLQNNSAMGLPSPGKRGKGRPSPS